MTMRKWGRFYSYCVILQGVARLCGMTQLD